MKLKRIKEIENAICAEWQITPDQLLGKRGKREITDARHACWWVMVKFRRSRTTIESRYNTSQAAITHAIQKIEDLISIKDPIRDKIFKVINSLV